MFKRLIPLSLLLIFVVTVVSSAELKSYQPAKVVYDVSSHDANDIKHILDRVSLLQKIYGSDSFDASIIIVLHEGVIPLFAKANQNKHKDLMRRANSLTMGDIIQFRLCSASARMQGFKHIDFHDFIAMVPMADAEIVQLQQKGYAYLR